MRKHLLYTLAFLFFGVLLSVKTAQAAIFVEITSPTSSDSYALSSSNNIFTVSGTASGTVPIAHVVLTVDVNGYTATTSGTSTWSGAVGLSGGAGVPFVNVITVTATDINGSTTTDSLSVSFTWENRYVEFADTTIDVGTDKLFSIGITAYDLNNASSTDISFFYDPAVLTYVSRSRGASIDGDDTFSTSTAGLLEKIDLHSPIMSSASSATTLEVAWFTFRTPAVAATTSIMFDAFTINRDVGGNIIAATGTAATVDIGDPTITIESPTRDPLNYFSADDLMFFSGSATDNLNVDSVIFYNAANGDSGTATITGSGASVTWEAYVDLATGTNAISFVVNDGSGAMMDFDNTATDTVSVYYLDENPIVEFSTTSVTVATDTLFSFDVSGNYLSEAEETDFHLLYDPNKLVLDSYAFAPEYDFISWLLATSSIDANTEDAFFNIIPNTMLDDPAVPDNATSSRVFGTFTFRALDFSGTSTISFASSSVIRTVPNVSTDMTMGQALTVNIPAPTDLTHPAITITYPTSGSAYNFYSTSGSISLQGTSTDNTAVTSVTYVNSAGGSGSMTGTATWSGSVSLAAGTNLISVVAHDAAGNTATDTISVYYIASNPAVAFSTTTMTKATSTSFSFNVTGNYFSEAQTIGINILYDPSMLSYSTTTYGAAIGSATVSTSTSGSLRRLAYLLTPSSVPYSASSSATILTPTFTTLTTTGTTTINFGTSTVNRASFNSNVSTSTTVTVAIPAPDLTAPVRSGGSPSGNQAAGVTSVTMSVVTDENATCGYSTVAGTAFGSMTPFSTTGALSHSVALSGLAVGAHNYYVRCRDGSSNANADDYLIAFTIVAASSGGGGGGGGGSSAPAPVNAVNVPMFVTPAQSGSLTRNLITGDVARLSTVIGTVKNYSSLDIMLYNPASASTTANDFGLGIYGNLFVLAGTDAYGINISRAEKEMEVSLTFAQLPQSSSTRILYLDDSLGRWTDPQGTTSVDLVSRKIVFHTTSFGKFAVFTDKAIIGTSTGSAAATTTITANGTASQTVLPTKTDIEQEASLVFSRSAYITMDEASKKVYAKITAGRAIEQVQKYALADFIQNGTFLTKKLGAGERGGVVNSFFAAFGRLPKTETDWQDVVKIARGRWPGQSNAKAEANAKAMFKKIYKREADMKNARDNAAVTIVAYGLRSVSRNTVNEANSIKSFKAIYGKAPVSATDWDIVRAIAYSGAKR